MELRAGSKISVSRPWAITRARPRPPTSRARVATIGWMPKREISTPLTTPMDAPPTSAIDDRDGRAVAEVERQQRGRDRHDRADREVDAPRADDQRHAQRDDRDRDDLDELQPDVVDLGEARGEHEVEGDQEQEPRRRRRARRPSRGPGRGRAGAAPRRTQRTTLPSSPLAAGGSAGSGFPTTAILEGAPSSVLEGGFFVLRPLGGCRDQAQHAVLGDLGARQRADDGAVTQDDDPVRALHDLLELGGDQDDRQPRFGQIADQALDLGLGADVDAARWIVEEQHPWLEAQDAGEQDLLLVAAGQLADPLVGTRRLDPQAAR